MRKTIVLYVDIPEHELAEPFSEHQFLHVMDHLDHVLADLRWPVFAVDIRDTPQEVADEIEEVLIDES